MADMVLAHVSPPASHFISASGQQSPTLPQSPLPYGNMLSLAQGITTELILLGTPSTGGERASLSPSGYFLAAFLRLLKKALIKTLRFLYVLYLFPGTIFSMPRVHFYINNIHRSLCLTSYIPKGFQAKTRS